MKKLMLLLAALLCAGGVWAAAPVAFADSTQCQGVSAVTGGSPCQNADSKLSNKLNSIINTIFFVGGAVAVLIIVIAGLRFVLSDGNADSVKGARNAIQSAVIGLIVLVLARAIVAFVVGAVAG
jgi:cytochrome bd-type quinol oxidase subunit 2